MNQMMTRIPIGHAIPFVRVVYVFFSRFSLRGEEAHGMPVCGNKYMPWEGWFP